MQTRRASLPFRWIAPGRSLGAAAALWLAAGPARAVDPPAAAPVVNPAPAAPTNAIPRPGPLSAVEELKRFHPRPGFQVELIAEEAPGIGKFVSVAWDAAGNLWTMTALEYPLDGNENPTAAQQLYAARGRDQVLVYDRQPGSPTGYAAKPRVFLDGLAQPEGMLPYKNGVLVQHGSEILFATDPRNTGHADRREVILKGFGVQDSHMLPHQFTRAPGNWIWFAQGAFNFGHVQTLNGRDHPFNQAHVAKFRPDGFDFAPVSEGPCNVWGMVLDRFGRLWIQEANDYGYPVVPFAEGAYYPGCSAGQAADYAPEFPPAEPVLQMGANGLSGLALADPALFPTNFADVFFLAHARLGRVQAVQVTGDDAAYRPEKLPDLLTSDDPWFRPVALQSGPDGCLYVVDWYNPVIAHSEVPRSHPDRDKTRGRIWRVRPQDRAPLAVPDFSKLPPDELVARLGASCTAQSHLAWQTIADRGLRDLSPRLRAMLADPGATVPQRLAALWALEGLRGVDLELLKPLLIDAAPALRREAVRAHRDHALGPVPALAALRPLLTDPVPAVRAEVIRTVGGLLAQHYQGGGGDDSAVTTAAVELLVRAARAPLPGAAMKHPATGHVIPTGAAYDREFERFLARRELESHPVPVGVFLDGDLARSLPVESRLLAALAMDSKAGAVRVAECLPELDRPLLRGEILRLARYAGETEVAEVLAEVLEQPRARRSLITGLLAVGGRVDAAKLHSVLLAAGRQLLRVDSPDIEMGLRLATELPLPELEGPVTDVLRREWLQNFADNRSSEAGRVLLPQGLAALRALRQMHGGYVELFENIARSAAADSVRIEALSALAGSVNIRGPELLLARWPELSGAERTGALAALTAAPAGARAALGALQSGVIERSEIDAPTADQWRATLGENSPAAATLATELAAWLQPCLHLDGSAQAWTDPDLELPAAFTVETWFKPDADHPVRGALLGAQDGWEWDFADGRPRVHDPSGRQDLLSTGPALIPGRWTHLALTRDAAGHFQFFIQGEPVAGESPAFPAKFVHGRLGWRAAGPGLAGWLGEFRVWDRVRSPAELRRDFDRHFEDGAVPGLVRQLNGFRWGQAQAGARVTTTADFPPLLTPTEVRVVADNLAKYEPLAAQPGDAGRGRAVFNHACLGCHRLNGLGGELGPALDHAGTNSVGTLLRQILTPRAYSAPAYRPFRLEMNQGEPIVGRLLSATDDLFVLRRAGRTDLTVPRAIVRRAVAGRGSLMPADTLDALSPGEVSDLLAWLRSLHP